MPVSGPLPFSQASENNKLPIMGVLQRHLQDRTTVLEIGGGTGQHAEFFSSQLPQLVWQSSDVPDQVETLNLRIAAAKNANLPAAIAIDVDEADWNSRRFDAIFTANTLHIMSQASVTSLFKGLCQSIQLGGLLLVYGPFKYRGDYTTQSNARFDLWLKQRDPSSGIRDFEWVNELAKGAGFELIEDNAMPANNQLLVWRSVST